MARQMKNEPTERRRGIQSVEIGLAVLQSLSALESPSPLSIVAQACNMAAPQVHRYLQSLIKAGMVRQDAESGRYELGPEAIKLGLSALARTDAFKLVDARISEFARRAGRTILVAALGPLGPTVVRWYSGAPAVVTSLSVGSVLSTICSATGRVFLAFDKSAQMDSLAAKELRRTPLPKSDLAEIVAQVRQTGQAHVSGTIIPGLDATAFPIFNLQGTPILVATLLTPTVLKDSAHADSVSELGALCRQIGNDLGWS